MQQQQQQHNTKRGNNNRKNTNKNYFSTEIVAATQEKEIKNQWERARGEGREKKNNIMRQQQGRVSPRAELVGTEEQEEEEEAEVGNGGKQNKIY